MVPRMAISDPNRFDKSLNIALKYLLEFARIWGNWQEFVGEFGVNLLEFVAPFKRKE